MGHERRHPDPRRPGDDGHDRRGGGVDGAQQREVDRRRTRRRDRALGALALGLRFIGPVGPLTLPAPSPAASASNAR
ncbi:MAG: hypothetical protein R3F65_22625 [bacterium]